MPEQIRTKVFTFGHDKEGSWPPLAPSGEKGYFRVDKDGVITDEPPEPLGNCFGQAPYVIQDTIEAYRHPGSGQVLTSRKALAETDRACGTITTDKRQAPDPTWSNEQRKAMIKDRKEARKKAIEQVNAPGFALPEETRHACKERNAQLSQQLGIKADKIGTKDKKGNLIRG